MCQYSSCLTHTISLRIESIPIFLSRVCSSNETFSVRLNLLLGKLLSPSTSLSPLVSGPPVPILNRSSKSPKSITLCSRSSSNSLNIVPRTWEQEISHMLYDGIDVGWQVKEEVEWFGSKQSQVKWGTTPISRSVYEYHNPQTGWPMPWPSFKLGTSWVEV